jgi:hypothetical protein
MPLKPALDAAMFEAREPFLGSLYLGASSLALLGAGLALSSAPGKRFFAAFGTVALLVALGRNAPFYGLLCELLPPLRILRYPVKALVMVALCWALLAGFGFDAWRAYAAAGRRRFLAATAGPAAALAVAALALVWLASAGVSWWGPLILAEGTLEPWNLRRLAWRLGVTAALAVLSMLLALGARPGPWARWTGAGVALLALGDLAALHRNIQPVAPVALFTHRPEVLGSLGAGEETRIYAYDYTTPSPRYGKRDGLRNAVSRGLGPRGRVGAGHAGVADAHDRRTLGAGHRVRARLSRALLAEPFPVFDAAQAPGGNPGAPAAAAAGGGDPHGGPP